MNTQRTCPNCQESVPADAPAGVCPACALRAAFDIHSDIDSPTLTQDSRRPGRQDPAPPLAAEELAGHLPELEDFELIGQGGMGAVYRARHRRLDRPVAVKVLDPALGADDAFAERFAREAQTLAKLDHPNIVRVYDFDHRDGLYFLIMELVDGVNLRQTIHSGGLSPEEALAVVPHLCEALQYAHDQGVVHRDIKPENILVDRSGRLRIADFGLAKLLGEEGDTHLTRTRQVMGTPNYMAPEQVEKPGTVDHRADIFALGVVFYELLTGELPIGRFPLPSRKVEIDVRLDDVVLRSLEKEPHRRYQQARELQSDVESISQAGPFPHDHGFTPPPIPAMAPQAPTSSTTPEIQRTDYEYRSPEIFFGLPLVHIAFSRDPEGVRARVASGIIAIGDIAVGGIAIGGLACGGITFGGLSFGLLGFGGIALGLLAAMGGLAVGAYAVAGSAFGIVTHGVRETHWLTLTEPWLERLHLFGWFLASCAITAGLVAAGFAWFRAATAKIDA